MSKFKDLLFDQKTKLAGRFNTEFNDKEIVLDETTLQRIIQEEHIYDPDSLIILAWTGIVNKDNGDVDLKWINRSLEAIILKSDARVILDKEASLKELLTGLMDDVDSSDFIEKYINTIIELYKNSKNDHEIKKCVKDLLSDHNPMFNPFYKYFIYNSENSNPRTLKVLGIRSTSVSGKKFKATKSNDKFESQDEYYDLFTVFQFDEGGLATTVQGVFIPVNNRKELAEEKIVESLRSAKAAIISRNLSHNIGSHVLSAISSNYCHPSDMKVLSKYVQERMDFVAQVITNPPKWTAPTWFIRNIIRKFFEQRLLLKYIVRSEGLECFEYRNVIQSDKAKIKFNLYIDDDEIGKKGNGNFKDVLVSIPGGVVGYHAIYTIIENFLRNGAKHGWDREKSELDEYIINIKISKESSSDYVVVSVSDNIIAPPPNTTFEELSKNLNDKINTPFINPEDGKIISSNWGLAEMKIAAAYLSKKSNKFLMSKGILMNSPYGIMEYFPSKNTEGNTSLGLRFKIQKPKEVLVITDKLDLQQLGFLNSLTRPYAIYFSNFGQKTKNIGDFELVYFDLEELSVENLDRGLYSKRQIFRNELSENNEYEKFLEKVERVYTIIRKARSGSDSTVNLESIQNELSKTFCENFKIDLFSIWSVFKLKTFIIRNYFEKTKLEIYINSNSNSPTTSNEFNLNSGKDVLLNRRNLEQYFGSEHSPSPEVIVEYEKSGADEKLELREKHPYLKKWVRYKKEISYVFYKYEEDIESLPEYFVATQDLGKESEHIRLGNFKDDQLVDELNEIDFLNKYLKATNTPEDSNINLIRHVGTGGNNVFYSEYLSGAQNYFTLLETDLDRYERMKLYLQIVESVSLTIGIIDERVSEYFMKDLEVLKKLKNMNVHVFPIFIEEKDTNIQEWFKKNDGFNVSAEDLFKCNKKEMQGGLDFLIIHQSFLEKKFRGKEKEIVVKIADYYETNIVLTTGRGRQSDSLKEYSFISFSELREALLKSYPEKLMLINSLVKNSSIDDSKE